MFWQKSGQVQQACKREDSIAIKDLMKPRRLDDGRRYEAVPS